MNTKKSITIIYIFLWAILNPVFAQNSNNLSISGTLLDADSKEPVEYASVVLFNLPDTTLITGVITSPEGKFTIPKIQSGNYLIKRLYPLEQF